MTGPLHPHLALELARLRAGDLAAHARRDDRDSRRQPSTRAAASQISSGEGDPRRPAQVTPGSDGTVTGLDAACAALAAGRAVVLPNATPLAYILVATSPRAVNRVKGRALEQSVGITLYDDADWRALQPMLDLTPDAFARMLSLMRQQLLSFLAPVRPNAELPEWLRPAVRDGWLGAFAGRWRPLTPLWERFPRLFGSSANRTGQPPVGSAAEAAAVFGDQTVVIDGDAQRELAATRGASTILRIWPDGTIALHRTGAHDAGLSAHDYLARLAARNSSGGTRDRPAHE